MKIKDNLVYMSGFVRSTINWVRCCCELTDDKHAISFSRMATSVAFLAALFGCLMSLYVLMTSSKGLLSDAVIYLISYILVALMITRFVNERKKAVLLIMIMAFLLHAVVLKLTHVHYTQSMISDFAGPQNCICNPDRIVAHPPMFLYWCNYEFICSILGDLLGRHIVVGQMLNVVCCILTIPPVFIISERIGGFFMGCFTSFFMGSAPSILVYSTILTNEFIASMLYVYSFYFFLECIGGGAKGKKLVNAAWSGTFLGIALLFKPVFVVVACAMAFGFMIAIFNRHKAGIACWAFVCLVIFFSSRISSRVVQTCLLEGAKSHVLCQKRDSAGLLKMLLVGLHCESSGRWYPECVELESQSPDELFKLLKKNVKRDFRSYPSLWLRKLGIAFVSFDWVYWYDMTIAPKTSPMWVSKLVVLGHKVFWLLFLMGSTGLMLAVFVRKELVMTGLLLMATIGAYTAGIMVAEVQPRYKMTFYPFFFLVISYAGMWLKNDNPIYCWCQRCARRFLEGGARSKSERCGT